MAGSLGSIFVDLIANTGKFESGMRGASRTMSSNTSTWQRQLIAVDKQFEKVGISVGKIGAALAGAVSIGAIVGNLRSVVNEMDEIGKASDRLGIATEALSKISYAGSLADVSLQDVEKTVRTMQKALVEGASGSKTFTESFERLGLSARDLLALKPEDAFAKLLDAIVKIENPTIRNATALEIFGRSGLKLINFAAEGSKGLQELYEEAQKLGVVFDREAAASAERFNDSLVRVGKAFDGLSVAFVNTGALDSFSESLEGIAHNMDTIASVAQVLVVILGARLLGAIGAATAAFVLGTQQAIAYQLALARMAGVSATAATGIGAMTAATTLFSRAMTLLGGPIGVFIATLFAASEAVKLFTGENTQAAEVAGKFAKTLSFANGLTAEYATASEERRRVLREETQETIDNLSKQLEAWQLFAQHFNDMSMIGRALGRGAGKLGLGPDVDALEEQFRGMAETLEKLKGIQAGGFKGGGSVFDTGSVKDTNAATEAQKALEESTRDAQRVFDSTRTAAEKYAIEVSKLDELLQKGLITQDTYTRGVAAAAEEMNNTDDAAKRAQDAARDLGMTFTSAFEDAAVEGKKFSDVLGGLAKDIYRIFIRSTITEPIGGFFKNLFSGGGSGGGGLSSLFSLFSGGSGMSPGSSGFGGFFNNLFSGFFADGGFIPPGKIGITGEEGPELTKAGPSGLTVFPNDAFKGMGGRGAGNTYVIDARGTDNSVIRRLESALQAGLGPGRIEHRVTDAQARGAI